MGKLINYTLENFEMRKNDMKIKHLVQKSAVALAVAAMAVFAHAGDIWNISLVENHPIYGGDSSSLETPLTIGQKAVIRMRLGDWDCDSATASAWNFYPADSSWVTGSTELSNSSFYAPELGLKFGGKTILATYVGREDIVNTDNGYKAYTDLYFSYKVESGDIAMPARLLDKNQKVITDSSTATEYYINLKGMLKLANGAGASATNAVLSYMISSDPRYSVLEDIVVDGVVDPSVPDITGEGMGLYVKTVDLDTNLIDPTTGVWREIQQGLTATTGNGLPSVVVNGTSTEPITVWVWSADNNIATPDDSDGAYWYTNKTSTATFVRKLLKVSIPKGESSSTFAIRGVNIGTTEICMSSTESCDKLGYAHHKCCAYHTQRDALAHRRHGQGDC